MQNQSSVVAATPVDLGQVMVTSSMGDYLCVASGREARCGPYEDREGRFVQRWQFDAPIQAIDTVGGGVCVALANEGLRCWGCYRCWPAGARCEAECATEPELVVDRPIRHLAHEVALTTDGQLHLWRVGEGWGPGPDLGVAIRLAAHTRRRIVYVTEDGRLWIGDRRLEQRMEVTGDAARVQSLVGGWNGVCALSGSARVECWIDPMGADEAASQGLSDKGLSDVRRLTADFCALDQQGRLSCWDTAAERMLDSYNSSEDNSPEEIDEGVQSVAQFGLHNLCWSTMDGRLRCNSKARCTVLPHLLGPIEYVPAGAREICIDF